MRCTASPSSHALTQVGQHGVKSMNSISNAIGAPLGPTSSEKSIRAALQAFAASGDMGAVAKLETTIGVVRGRLVEECSDLSSSGGHQAPDGHVQLAFDLLNETHERGAHLIFDGLSFRRYDAKIWRPLCLNKLKQLLMYRLMRSPAAYGDGKSNSIVAGAVRALQTLRFKEGFPSSLTEDEPAILNVQNGEIWLDHDGDCELRPHRSWSRLTSICPFELDYNATCPRFDKALAEIFACGGNPPEMIRHFLEVMAYGVQPRRHIPAIVILRGAGANGKSALLKIWAALLGEDQVLWNSVARLSADRFTLPELAGRRLFIDDDAKDGVRLDDGLLKSIAEDKPISARRAHAPDAVSFRARVLPIVSMNGAPTLSDSSFGFERRLLVLPFERRFAESEMDRGLADHIIANERAGILVRLLEAYQRLCQRGHFEEPDDCRRAKAELLAASNPLRAFIDDACRPAMDTRVRVSDLYAAFKSWRRVNGISTSYTRIAFTQRLSAMGLDVYKSVGVSCVRGFQLVDGPASFAEGGDL